MLGISHPSCACVRAVEKELSVVVRLLQAPGERRCVCWGRRRRLLRGWAGECACVRACERERERVREREADTHTLMATSAPACGPATHLRTDSYEMVKRNGQTKWSKVKRVKKWRDSATSGVSVLTT